MAYKARWYTEEGHLRKIGREHLARLFERYTIDLAEVGIVIAEPEDDDAYYRSLVDVFMRPEGIPNALHDALYYIKGLDNEKGEARLVKAVHEGRLAIELDGERSTADKALLAWLANENLVKNMFIEVGLDASRSFLTLRAVPGTTPTINDFESVRAGLQDGLATLFKANSRAEWARVTLHKRDRQFVFVVERTATFKRDTQHRDNGTKPLYYWPTEQDLVVYDEEFHDLRMNVTSKWQKDGYAAHFGLHLFGDKTLFKEAPKYSLQPILTRGRSSLEGSAFGIAEIRLAELSFKVSVDDNDYRIRRSDDVFASYEREGGLPTGEEPASAKFGITFEDGAGERMLTIQPPNRAKYLQDQQGAKITKWMKGQGYIVDQEPLNHVAVPGFVANDPPRRAVAIYAEA